MKAEDAISLLREAAGVMADRLPDDCVWSRTSWRAIDENALRHVYSEDWAQLSRNTGLLAESAAAVRKGAGGAVAERIREIAADFDPALCDPIFLGANAAEGPYVVIDGNHRVTAITLCRPDGVEELPVILAVSKSAPIRKWEG